MGTSQSTLDPNFSRSLHQESAYITYAQKFGKEFSVLLNIPHGPQDTRGNAFFSSPQSTIRLHVKNMGDFPLSAVKPTLVMSACAWQGRDDIDNILDGYNSGLFLQVGNDVNDGVPCMKIQIAQKPVEDDMFQRELNPVSTPLRPNATDTCWCCTREYDPNDPTIMSVPLSGANKKEMSCWNRGVWSGLFNGKLNLWKLIRPKSMLDRTTGHQPIWTQGNLYFCSTINWQQIRIDEDQKTKLLVAHPILESKKTSPLLQELSEFPLARSTFFCMHPHEDVNYVNLDGVSEPRMLTYSFNQSKLFPSTTVTFYEFGLESPLQDNVTGRSKKITKFVVNHYAQLHMFGFTRNYYLIFANPLSVDKLSMCWKGTPVLRAMSDNFESNLIIYIVRRPDAPKYLPEYMAVDTRQQGNMYHTVNCYEEYKYADSELEKMYVDEKYASYLPKGSPSSWTSEQRKVARHSFPSRIVLDGWASQLNAVRESSQFELRQDDAHSVYENQGSLYRYIMYLDKEFKVRANYSFCVCPEIISSIDFHCINPHNYGRSYRSFWLVAHHRERPVSAWNPNGQIEHVESILYSINMPSTLLDLDEERLRDGQLLNRMIGSEKPWRTSEHLPQQWQGHLISYYMRTPMFVARHSIAELSGSSALEAKERKEKDGYLFVWCYRVVHDFRSVDTNKEWREKDVAEAIKEKFTKQADDEKKDMKNDDANTNVPSSALLLATAKLIQRPPNYENTQQYRIDENLLDPYGQPASSSATSGSSAKGAVSPISEHNKDIVHPLRSGAFLLIFDANTMSSTSQPWQLEFDDKDVNIPYSVHSFSHQFSEREETEEEKKRRVAKVEGHRESLERGAREANNKSERKKSDNAAGNNKNNSFDAKVSNVRKDSEMVPLTIHHEDQN